MSDDMRERILDTGEELLRRFGPSKTTVVDIARALEMSHANIYRYFPSKADLLDAIAERWLGRVAGPLEAIATGAEPAGERLVTWIVALQRQKRRKVVEDPEIFAVYSAIAKAARGIIARHHDDLSEQLRRIIGDGIRDGAFVVRDLDAAVGAILDATIAFRHPVLVADRAALPDDLRAAAVGRMLVSALEAGTL
jgi:AcrR family transcriptional regulator